MRDPRSLLRGHSCRLVDAGDDAATVGAVVIAATPRPQLTPRISRTMLMLTADPP